MAIISYYNISNMRDNRDEVRKDQTMQDMKHTIKIGECS